MSEKEIPLKERIIVALDVDDADKAKESISKAIELFEQCEEEVYLEQAKKVLESLR